MKILIVDDDYDILLTLKIMLQSKNYTVEISTATTYIGSAIQDFQPDLLLLDINMRPFNGLEVCSNLKNLEIRDIPVVLMSGLHNTEQLAYQAGAAGYIAKPFRFTALLSRLQEAAGSMYN